MEYILLYMFIGVIISLSMEIMWSFIPHNIPPLKSKDRIGIFILWPIVAITFLIAFIAGLIIKDK